MLSTARASLALLFALHSGCKTAPDSASGGRTEPSPHGAGPRAQLVNPRAAPVEPLVQSPLETIAVLEDARSDGDGLLEVLLVKGETHTRVRAAVALGRLPYPEHGAEVTAALDAALKDESPLVRSAAAFGIGERGDPASAAALSAGMREPDAREPDAAVRARIVEAASRIEVRELQTAVLHALQDPSGEVRVEAAIGPHRWPVKPAAAPAGSASTAGVPATTTGAPATTSGAPATTNGALLDDPAIDSALIDAARGRPEDSGAGADPLAAVVVKPALFSLMRRKCERARGLFLQHAADPDDPETRIFAIQGLGNIAADADTNRALCRALGDGDWRVVCEAALALGKHPDCESVPALAARADHKSAHVRRCVYEALGNFSACKTTLRPVLDRAQTDISANVRGAALEAEAKLYGDEVAYLLERAINSKDPLVRAGAASAAVHLSSKLAVPLLVRLSKDSNRRVADIATHGLEDHPTESARERLRELLVGPDNGLRLAAVEALRKQKNPADLPLLAQCFETAQGEIANELDFGVLESAAAIGGKAALDLVEKGLASGDPYVRKRARELIAESFPDAALPHVEPPAREPAQVPVKDRDFMYDGNPRVEVRTSKGSMIFELLPDETPVHVVSFIELVKAHHYDDLSFHRVVPDFVIQGGDVRGDGNGGASWRGDALRSEFTPRKFLRGSLGMPRNEDPDSGGSQIFVTHRWTPHLDGRYTLFGTLVSGGEVLDTIEVGDTILEVKELPPQWKGSGSR